MSDLSERLHALAGESEPVFAPLLHEAADAAAECERLRAVNAQLGEVLQFCSDALVRINDNRAVETNDQEMLNEELEDMASNIAVALAAAK